MSLKCPYCKHPVDILLEKLEYHKNGRTAKCPKCKKKIIFTRTAKNLTRDDNGNLKKKYVPRNKK